MVRVEGERLRDEPRKVVPSTSAQGNRSFATEMVRVRRPLFRRPAPGTTCGRSVELRQRGEGHEQLDRPRNAWSPSDESALLKLDNHPMDGGRSDPKEPLHVGLRGRASVELQIGVDEREVLPLLARK